MSSACDSSGPALSQDSRGRPWIHREGEKNAPKKKTPRINQNKTSSSSESVSDATTSNTANKNMLYFRIKQAPVSENES